MIARDNLPLNTVEKDGFKYLMKTIAPLYHAPSRKKISRLIEEKYHLLSGIIKQKLIETVSHITLTTDIWTETMTTTAFLGVTGHFLSENKLNSIIIGVYELGERHTSDYIGQCISNICKEWHISDDKVTTVVTDNGANMVKAVSDLFGKNKQLPCFAHTLDLVASKIIQDEDMKIIIEKVKLIVTYFKQSVVTADEFRKAQPANNILRLIQSVPTRWNSTYYMLERFINRYEYIAPILLKNPKTPNMLDACELGKVNEFLQILGPIKSVTEEICGEKYLTASKIIPIVNCLFKKIDSLSPSSKEVLALKDKTSRELSKRFGAIEQNTLLAVSTILDPRFKKLHFNSPVACSKAISFINQSLQCLSQLHNEKETQIGKQSPIQTSPSTSLWDYHEELAAKQRSHQELQEGDSMNYALKIYLNGRTIPISADPLAYWDNESFQLLKELAFKYLAIVGTSVPSERLFSKAGNIITPNRNRLSEEKLQQLLFLGSLKFENWNLD